MSSSSPSNFTPLAFANASCDAENEDPKLLCWVSILWCTLACLTSVIGTPANFMVLFMLMKTRQSSSPSDLFIMNLALMDGTFCFFVPVNLLSYFVFRSKLAVTFTELLYFLNILGVPLLYAALCGERYLAVVWATRYARFRDIRYRAACCAVVWAITLAMSCIHISNRTNSIKHLNACMSLLYPICTSIIFCNFSVLRALRNTPPGMDKIHPARQQAFRMVLVISALVIATYSPVLIMFPFQNYFPSKMYGSIIQPICFCFFTTGSCIHPLVYLYVVGKQSYMKELLKMKRERQRSQ